jgi:serine protease
MITHPAMSLALRLRASLLPLALLLSLMLLVLLAPAPPLAPASLLAPRYPRAPRHPRTPQFLRVRTVIEPRARRARGSTHTTTRPSPFPSTKPPRVSNVSVPGSYLPSTVVVKYVFATPTHTREATARAAGAADPTPIASHTRLLQLRPGMTVAHALARLRHERDVAWAVPDYTAHAAEAASPSPAPAQFIPDDPGNGTTPGGWQQLQWNFDGTFGVEAPQAWANLMSDHAPGGAGRGIVVAVLDTGIAYANRGRFRRSPDFTANQFVAGYDFIAHTPYAMDRNGHGTQVAGTIAEATDNGRGVTGLAYGVRLMPVRVLNAEGEGDASVIAQGVRFAVNHGARLINLSLEFSSFVTAADIPELLEALRYAHHRGVLVVAAAGNEGNRTVAYPARAPEVVSVGATTEHGCLASYSNDGARLTLVAPGGGPDADLPGDPNCQPEAPPGRDIYQETFTGASPRRFGLPSGYDGTSMATPHVSATAALIIASGVLGRHPTPGQIVARLRATARQLGGPSDHALYGAGLVDAAAATAPGGPGVVR